MSEDENIDVAKDFELLEAQIPNEAKIKKIVENKRILAKKVITDFHTKYAKGGENRGSSFN